MKVVKSVLNYVYLGTTRLKSWLICFGLATSNKIKWKIETFAIQLTLISCPIFKLKYIVTFWYFGVLRRIVEWLNKHSAVISTPAKGKATS